MPPEIAVVVPTYRRPDRLKRLVDALSRQTLAPSRWELIVVDDRSNDPRVDDLVAELPAYVSCRTLGLRTARNGGPAIARNVGWQATRAPILAFVDDDVVPSEGWLEAGLRAFSNPTVGVVQGHTTLPAGVVQEDLSHWFIWRRIEEAGPYFEACNIFYRRAALDEVGGFDEDLGWWGEDASLGWRVVEGGWSSAFSNTAIAAHDAEMRGVRWSVVNGWWEQHLVILAARHPGFRREAFWRPWAYRPRDAAFALAVAAALVGLRWRPALFGVLPYLWIGRPSIRQPHFLRRCVELFAVDAARSAGQLVGSVRAGILVI